MQRWEALTFRYQNALAIVTGFTMLCITMAYLARAGTPAYAAATDSKGSPNVAIGKFFAKDGGGNTWLKIVYADGHVGDPVNGGTVNTGTLQCLPVAAGGGTSILNMAPTGGAGNQAIAYAIGSDGYIYRNQTNWGASWGGWTKYGPPYVPVNPIQSVP